MKVEASKQSIGLSRGPAFLFGGGEIPKQPELLARLPSREAVDKLVVRYFNDYDPAIRKCGILQYYAYLLTTVDILHQPSWRRVVR